MITSPDVQAVYADLFSNMRNYIWDLDVVEMLADVEVDTFDAFIDMDKLSKDYQKLFPMVIAVADSEADKELKDSAEAFKQLIENVIADEEPAYLDLYRVQETIDHAEPRGRTLEEEREEGLLEPEEFIEEEAEEEIPEEEEVEEEEE